MFIFLFFLILYFICSQCKKSCIAHLLIYNHKLANTESLISAKHLTSSLWSLDKLECNIIIFSQTYVITKSKLSFCDWKKITHSLQLLSNVICHLRGWLLTEINSKNQCFHFQRKCVQLNCAVAVLIVNAMHESFSRFVCNFFETTWQTSILSGDGYLK